ncbi:MAG: hypothetical protein INR71_09695, partial [Terriglobus roseus]|nr:hypothetical protein [Terriglobus roseus]
NTQPTVLPSAPSPASAAAPSQSSTSLPLPNTNSNITISPDTTLNGTVPGNSPPQTPPQSTLGLNVELVNNFGTSNVNIYVTALDETGRVMLLTPAQTWFYPTASSSDVPQAIDQELAIPLGAVGATLRLNLPGYFASGRIYVSLAFPFAWLVASFCLSRSFVLGSGGTLRRWSRGWTIVLDDGWKPAAVVRGQCRAESRPVVSLDMATAATQEA